MINRHFDIRLHQQKNDHQVNEKNTFQELSLILQ